MNIRSLAVIICSLFILNGCSTTDSTETLVKNYISESLGVEVNTIDIIELNDATPWMTADSLKFLSELLQSEKEVIIGHLESAIEASKKAIDQAEKVTNSGFPALADVAEETIKQSKETIELAREKLEQMDGDLKGTALELLNNRVEKFKSMEDKMLFQILTGKWSGSDGEENDFHLMADQDLSKIIGKFGN